VMLLKNETSAADGDEMRVPRERRLVNGVAPLPAPTPLRGPIA